MTGNTTAVTEKPISSVKYAAFIGMFGAIASILMLIEFPLPFAPSFYEIDFSEVSVLIGGFTLGPMAGVLIELVKVLVNLLINGTTTAGVGELANFLIGCSLVVPAAVIYRREKTKAHAIVGMIAGSVFMAVVGCLMNAFVLLPAYGKAFHMDISALVAMGTAVNPAIHDLFTFCLFSVAPFNLLKGVLTAVVTLVLYKHISRLIHASGI
jgi:riboflavin transporter FmnP